MSFYVKEEFKSTLSGCPPLLVKVLFSCFGLDYVPRDIGLWSEHKQQLKCSARLVATSLGSETVMLFTFSVHGGW